MAVTEKDIQLYIWGLKDDWVKLIKPVNFPESKFALDEKEDILGIEPQKLLLNQVYERLSYLDCYVRETSLMGCEVQLKKDADSTIRADLLCSSKGRAGFGIIEIKKSNQTERQAYTELLGYGNHIQGLFPGMSTEDLAYILIAPMEERIVREATLISLLNDEKPVYCLQPVWTGDDVKTLQLIPWIPMASDLVKVSEIMFHPSNIEIFKLTWDEVPDWNYDPEDKNPEPAMVNTMNKLSIYASQLMEAKHISGFVFASQPWREMPLLPNSLIVAGINSFKVSILLKLVEQGADIYRLEHIDYSKIKLEDILPEIINGNNAIAVGDYLEWLAMGWNNTITEIAYETFKTMTTNSEGAVFETDHGGMTWKEYQRIPMEDVYVHNYDVRPTGLLRKLFKAYQDIDYEYLTKFGYEEHTHHFHGDIPVYAIDNWYKISYFRSFIDRLFDEFYEIRDDIIDAEDEAKVNLKNRSAGESN